MRSARSETAAWAGRLTWYVGLTCTVASCGRASELRYDVVFPSQSAAVSSEEIEIAVFDGTDPSSCMELVEKTRTRQSLPVALAQTRRLKPCELLGDVDALLVTDGLRALLVRTYAKNDLFLLGCSRFASPQIESVSLSLPAGVQAPGPSGCLTLAERCSTTPCPPP